MLQCTSAQARWWKQYKADNMMFPSLLKGMQAYKTRRDFIMAFGDGAGRRIKLSRETIIGEAEISTPGTGLMLRDRKQDVLDWMNQFGPTLHSSKSRLQRGDINGTHAGREAGLNANTGDSQIGRGRQNALN